VTSPVDAAPTSQDPTVLVQELKKRAVELGISWQLVTGTMTTTTTVLVDADTVAVPCVTLSGAHPEGTRVALLRIPPSGLYVIGVAESTEPATVIARGDAQVTALLVLTTTPTALTGGSFTVTLPSATYFEATAIFDLESTVAGAAIGQGFLYIDSVQQTGQALQSFVTVTRATVAQQWQGDLAAGTHLFELYAGKSAAAATARCNAIHTNVRASFYA
jgi:hypothetical protein